MRVNKARPASCLSLSLASPSLIRTQWLPVRSGQVMDLHQPLQLMYGTQPVINTCRLMTATMC
jgi:hypothetical protein